MDLNRLLNMIINTVMRRLVTLGVNKGFDLAAGKGDKAGPTSAGAQAADAASKQGANQTARKARQSAKLMRRMGRF